MQGSRNIIWISIALFTGLFFSCTKELDAEEYKIFVSNPANGLRVNQAVGDFELSAMYEPTNYLLAQGNGNASREEYEQFEHFQFRIKLNAGGNILLYKETQQQNEVTRINHFGFIAQNDFEIRTANDTNQCKMVHFSRNYNLSPTIDLSLAFDAIPKSDDWQLVYEDQQFNLGTIKFLFKESNLNNLPELKL